MTDEHGGTGPTLDARRRFLTELGPLLVFFLVNWKAGIYAATGAFMAALLIAMAYGWAKTRHVAPMMWVTLVLVLGFGGLTLWLRDETFIKMKPTAVYLIFSALLYAGLRLERNFLKTVLGAAFPPMSERGWTLLTRNWMLFFLGMAALNETVWRSVDTDIWVAFKTFGAIPLTFLFALSQAPLMLRHQLAEDDGGTDPEA